MKVEEEKFAFDELRFDQNPQEDKYMAYAAHQILPSERSAMTAQSIR